MCDIFDYLYMCTNESPIICSSIVADYPYYHLLLIIYICVLHMYKWMRHIT